MKKTAFLKEIDFIHAKRITEREKYLLEIRGIETYTAIAIGVNGFVPAYFWVKKIKDVETIQTSINRFKRCLVSHIVMKDQELRYTYMYQLKELLTIINK